MKLTARFLILVSALLLAVGATAFSGWRALRSLDSALSHIVDDDVQRLLSITHARRAFRSMNVLERDYILSRSSQERAAMEQRMVELATELSLHLDAYAERMPPEDARNVTALRGVRERWLERDRRVMKAAAQGEEAALELSKAHKLDPVSWETEIGKLIQVSEARLQAQVHETRATAGRARTTSILVSGLALLLAGGLGGIVLLGIRRNLAELVTLNAQLEARVNERTRALSEREEALRLVLDSTGDGLLTVGLDGTLEGETSAATVAWFGPPWTGTKLWNYLVPEGGVSELHMQFAFEQLADDFLPWETSVDQMPRRIVRDGRTLELDYKPILDRGKLSKVLVVARDVSARLRSEELEQASREQQRLVGKLIEDRSAFVQFVQESEALLDTLQGHVDAAQLRRDLHTLKGNSAVYGMQSFAERCHALEERMESTGTLPSSGELGELAQFWRSRMSSIEDFLSGTKRGVLEIAPEEHVRMIEDLLERRAYLEILDMVRMWTWQRTAPRLAHLRSYTEHVARRLGKRVKVTLEANDLRVPDDYLLGFWPTLSHVVRNAVDHGVEPEDERARAGKSPEAQIRIETRIDGNDFLVSVADDGPGIDRALLLERARGMGLDVDEHTPLSELVFADGVSSRRPASELSGRGVGLSATRQACSVSGGVVELESEPGRGARFTFRFRRPVLKPSPLAAVLEQRWSLAPSSRRPVAGAEPSEPAVDKARSVS
jgi:two-component system chemotaxis sensor kinase CheA